MEHVELHTNVYPTDFQATGFFAIVNIYTVSTLTAEWESTSCIDFEDNTVLPSLETTPMQILRYLLKRNKE